MSQLEIIEGQLKKTKELLNEKCEQVEAIEKSATKEREMFKS